MLKAKMAKEMPQVSTQLFELPSGKDEYIEELNTVDETIESENQVLSDALSKVKDLFDDFGRKLLKDGKIVI